MKLTFRDSPILPLSLSTLMTLHFTRLPGCTTVSGFVTLLQANSDM